MMGPIITKDDSLARGIEMAGGALGEAMKYHALEKRQKDKFRNTNLAIEKELSGLSENPTATELQKAISRAGSSEDIDPTYFHQSLQDLLPMYKESMKLGMTNKLMSNMFPNSQLFGNRNRENFEPQQMSEISQSPEQQQQIQNQMIQQGISPYQAQQNQQLTPQQQRQQQMQQAYALQGIPSPNTIPQQLAENRIPIQNPNQPLQKIQQQQLDQMQQLQQQQLQQQQTQQRPLNTQQPLNTPQPSYGENIPPSEKHTIYSPGIGEVNRGQIDLMLATPDEGVQNIGKSMDQRWNQQFKQDSLEQKEIRKEYRDQIVKYSEPYQDINKIETGVNKLKEAQKLIQSGRVSLDDNWVRNVVNGFLEGHESPLAEVAKTPEQQKLWYILKDSLKSKDVGGSNPSTKEVLLSKTALPGDMKSQDANEYIIGNMLQNQENELFKAKTIRTERGKAGTPSFIQFQANVDDKVNKYSQKRQQEYDKSFAEKSAKKEMVAIASDYASRYRPETGNVWIMTPEGKTVQVPEKNIKKYVADGATLLSSSKDKKPVAHDFKNANSYIGGW